MDLSETIDQVARDLSNTLDANPNNNNADQESTVSMVTADEEGEKDDIVMSSPIESTKSAADEKLSPMQRGLRTSIIAIQNDHVLTTMQKAKKIQELMTAQYRSVVLVNSETTSENVTPAASPIITPRRSVDFDTRKVSKLNGGCLLVSECEASKTYNDEFNQVLGCKHYVRAAKMKAPCCDSFHTCRFCHDEKKDHEMDRFKVEEMMCMYCQTVQPIGQDCASCETRLGNYYCDDCHLWDGSTDRSIYHCDKCGICRVGRGLGEDYFHCDKCNVCLAIHLKDNHRCIERNLDSDCPICGEYLFTSTHTVIFMPCGHSIHWRCYQEHINNSYQCPICWKSLANMTSYFQQIDKMLEEHRMPAEYEHFWSVIFCNDCEEKSKTKYHFLYHKCDKCKSYNTKVLNTVQERPPAPASSSGGAGASAEEMEMVSELTENGSIRPRSSSNMSTTSSSFVPDDNETRNR